MTGGSGRWFWEIYRRLPREQVLIAAGENPRQDAFDRTHDLRVVLVIANSRNTERMLRDQWQLPDEQVHLLHPGVDTQHFVPAARDPAVRAQFGWGDRRVILTVGRLQKRKGHDHLILALPRIHQAIPNLLYAIVGDGEERASLEALATREGGK